MSLQLHNNMTMDCLDELQASHRCASVRHSDRIFFRKIVTDYLERSIEDNNSNLKSLLPRWLAMQCALRYRQGDHYYLRNYIKTKVFVGSYPVRRGSHVIRVLLAHGRFIGRLMQYLDSINVSVPELDIDASIYFYEYVLEVYEKIGRDRFRTGLPSKIISQLDHKESITDKITSMPVSEDIDEVMQKLGGDPFATLMIQYKMAVNDAYGFESD